MAKKKLTVHVTKYRLILLITFNIRFFPLITIFLYNTFIFSFSFTNLLSTNRGFDKTNINMVILTLTLL